MENNLKGTVLLIAILLTGLSAGLFYAWAVSVIPGTRHIPDRSYLETMQAINRAILNPGFFVIFLGALLLMLGNVYFQFVADVGLSFWVSTCACIAYLGGTLGITVFGNVPMNEALDLVQLDSIAAEEFKLIRLSYEDRWNKLPSIRTTFSVISLVLLLLAVRF